MMASVPFSQVSFSGSAHNHFALGHQPVISSQPSKLHVPLPIAHREKGSVNDDVKQRISYQSDINADELSHLIKSASVANHQTIFQKEISSAQEDLEVFIAAMATY